MALYCTSMRCTSSRCIRFWPESSWPPRVSQSPNHSRTSSGGAERPQAPPQAPRRLERGLWQAGGNPRRPEASPQGARRLPPWGPNPEAVHRGESGARHPWRSWSRGTGRPWRKKRKTAGATCAECEAKVAAKKETPAADVWLREKDSDSDGICARPFGASGIILVARRRQCTGLAALVNYMFAGTSSTAAPP